METFLLAESKFIERDRDRNGLFGKSKDVEHQSLLDSSSPIFS